MSNNNVLLSQQQQQKQQHKFTFNCNTCCDMGTIECNQCKIGGLFKNLNTISKFCNVCKTTYKIPCPSCKQTIKNQNIGQSTLVLGVNY